MINKKELRIGNWISDSDEKMFGVKNYRQITGYDIYNDELEDFSPIPLTSEILIKCAFKQHGNCYDLWVQVYERDGFVFRIVDVSELANTTGKFYYSTDARNDWFGKELKYLHQLQNLFYSLTHDELVLEAQNEGG